MRSLMDTVRGRPKRESRDLFSEEPKRSPAELFARAKMARNLSLIVTQNKTVIIKGYRRVGKSSLVYSMLNILARKNEYIILHADIATRHSEEELARFMLQDFVKFTYHRIGIDPPPYAIRANKLLTSNLKKITEKRSIGGTISASPSVSVGQTRYEELSRLKLFDVFGGVIQTAIQIKKPVVIALDEIQNIIEATKFDQNFQLEDFQEILRYLHDFPDIHLVLTGSYNRLMPLVLGQKYETPFHGRYLVEEEVPLFTESEAREYLNRGFKQDGIKFRDEWIRYVVAAIGTNVGWLAYFGKSYKQELGKYKEQPENLYLRVLQEVASSYETGIRDDIKISVEYSREIDENLVFEVIDFVSKHKFKNNLDPSFEQLREYIDAIGRSGNLKQAIDILEDFGIISFNEENNKIILVNPCIAFNAGISPRWAEDEIFEEKMVRGIIEEASKKAGTKIAEEATKKAGTKIAEEAYKKKGTKIAQIAARIAEKFSIGKRIVLKTEEAFKKEGTKMAGEVSKKAGTKMAEEAFKIAEEATKKAGTKLAEEDVKMSAEVYIGNKAPLNYVLEIVKLINEGNKTIVIKARGRAITTAVNVAEIAKNSFLPELKVKDIQIGTEVFHRKEGDMSVSTMDIVITK